MNVRKTHEQLVENFELVAEKMKETGIPCRISIYPCDLEISIELGFGWDSDTLVDKIYGIFEPLGFHHYDIGMCAHVESGEEPIKQVQYGSPRI